MVHAEIQNDLHFVILLEQPVKFSPFQFTILDKKKLAWKGPSTNYVVSKSAISPFQNKGKNHSLTFY